jgi:hypothetical protein
MGGCAMKVSFICEEKLKEKIGGLFLSSLLSMSTELQKLNSVAQVEILKNYLPNIQDLSLIGNNISRFEVYQVH